MAMSFPYMECSIRLYQSTKSWNCIFSAVMYSPFLYKIVVALLYIETAYLHFVCLSSLAMHFSINLSNLNITICDHNNFQCWSLQSCEAHLFLSSWLAFSIVWHSIYPQTFSIHDISNSFNKLLLVFIHYWDMNIFICVLALCLLIGLQWRQLLMILTEYGFLDVEYIALPVQ